MMKSKLEDFFIEVEPRFHYESQQVHAMRLINYFLDKGITSMTDINTLLRTKFNYTSGTLSASRKNLRIICKNKVMILQKETRLETGRNKSKEYW